MKMKKSTGITLVALVITIIILLILAGITMTFVVKDGFIQKAIMARKETENAQIQEEKDLEDYENKIKNYSIVTSRGGISESSEVLLWENPDRTSAFSAQTVALKDSLSNYKYIKIFFTNGDQAFSQDFPVIEGKVKAKIDVSVYMAGWQGHPLYYRNFSGEDKSIIFQGGFSSGAGDNNSTNEEVCVPLDIIGCNF